MDGVLKTRFVGDTSQLRTRIDLAKMISPEQFELERKTIFGRSWLPIGHVSDLPELGSYFVYDMPTFDTSLLVIRGMDDRVRCFHNVCTHRGNKLVREGAGCRRTFACRFHGWTFSPEGVLKLVTDEDQFEKLDKSSLGLKPVRSEVWEDLIFVNFHTAPRESLQDWLGEMHGQFSGYFGLHDLIGSNAVILECNWHLAVNSFTEGYHTMYLHKNTGGDYQGGSVNKQRHRPSIELLKRHHRFSAPGNPEHRILDVEAVAIRHGRKQLPAFDFDCSLMPPGVNPTRYAYWGFDNVALYPNFVMLNGNHWRIEMWFWPIDSGRTLFLIRDYAYKTRNLGERLSQAYFKARGRDVAREDLNTLEAQQKALRSGALSEVVLSRQEAMLQHHYRVTSEMVSSP